MYRNKYKFGHDDKTCETCGIKESMATVFLNT